MTNPGGQRPRITSGPTVHNPVYAQQAEARRQYLRSSIYDFVDSLPLGDSGEASRTAAYTQPDSTTCFYASVASIATALHHRLVNVRRIGAQAKAEGLLGRYGAETSHGFQERQRDFVRREMNVGINFIDPFHNAERVNALTYGLQAGRHVVFGLPRHWVALDGFRKASRSTSQVTWTGMNPYPKARRIEDEAAQHVTPLLVVERLMAADMPLVVVEGVERRAGIRTVSRVRTN